MDNWDNINIDIREKMATKALNYIKQVIKSKV